MKLYRIRNWSDLFENNRTRELKHMAWVPVPNRHDGDGYTTLVSRKNGAAIYGAWMVILQVASRCDPRGTLLRAPQKPHDAASIARITRLPESDIQAALDACTTETQWLEVEDIPTIPQEGAVKPQEGAPIPQEGAQEWNGKKEQNRTEQLEIPTKLKTAAFESAWIAWMNYRNKLKRPKDPHAMFSEQLNWLSAYTPSVAIEILNASIRNGYTGLFEPRNGSPNKPSTDRNAGTANEGKSSQYAGVGKVVQVQPGLGFTGHPPTALPNGH